MVTSRVARPLRARVQLEQPGHEEHLDVEPVAAAQDIDQIGLPGAPERHDDVPDLVLPDEIPQSVVTAEDGHGKQGRIVLRAAGVDEADRIERFALELDELITEGLVVIDDVEVVRYVGRTAPRDDAGETA